jgi:RNA polymerase sigma-70 factor, ECF subfamily
MWKRFPASRAEFALSDGSSRQIPTSATFIQQMPRSGLSASQAGQPLTHRTVVELYEEYGARLYRYATLLLADRLAAEDAVQEGFVQLSRAINKKPDREISFGYIATIVRNECFDALRRRRRRAEDPLPLLERASPDATEEERMVLDAALRALPAEQREVIYLKVFEGLTFQEIADRCGAGINTVASRYRYATAALRRALAPSDQA